MSYPAKVTTVWRGDDATTSAPGRAGAKSRVLDLFMANKQAAWVFCDGD